MSVTAYGYCELTPFTQRDLRDPIAIGAASVGVSGDASGGYAAITARLRNPNFVVWPIHFGGSMSVNGAWYRYRGYETYPSLGLGTSRNIELGGGMLATPPAAMATIYPCAVDMPFYTCVDPTNANFDVLEFRTTNPGATYTAGISCFLALFNSNVLSIPGGPRYPRNT